MHIYNIIVCINRIVSLHDIYVYTDIYRFLAIEKCHKKKCLKKLEKSIKTDIH